MKKTATLFSFLLIFLSAFITHAQQPVTFDWANTMGEGISTNGIGYSSVADASGNIYTVGSFTGIANFGDPGSSTYLLTSSGGKDIFVQAITPAGTVSWSKRFGGSGDDIAKSICRIGSTLYIVGSFNNTATFGTSITSAGLTDGFILSLNLTGSVGSVARIGGLGSDEINSISAVGTGSLCITGSFESTADLDPSASLTSFSNSAGLHDVFIGKLTTSFVLTWTQTLGGSGDDFGNSITSDASGNIYATGSFENTVDMDPGTAVSNIVSNGASDVFIEKLNAIGNFVWATNTGDINADVGKFIKTDASKNVFVLGDYTGTPDFNPGVSSFNLSSNGGTDIFMQKLDSLGNFINAFSEGGTLNDYGNAFTLDPTGNIYITGTFQSTVDFDPGMGISNITSAGLSDMFIQKLNPSFILLFVKSIQGIDIGISNSIITDASGNIYTSGGFGGVTNFDPGTTNTIQRAVNINNFYIHKLNSAGVFKWVHSNTSASRFDTNSITTDIYGNSYSTYSYSYWADEHYIEKIDPSGNIIWHFSDFGGSKIITDSSGNIYVIGGFSGTQDFAPGSAIYNITAANTSESFIVKLNNSGNLIWVKTLQLMTGNTYDKISALGIAVDTIGNVYLNGYFEGTVDFDPGIGVNNISSTTTLNNDAFVCKLDSLGSFVWVKKLGVNYSDTFGRGIQIDSYGNPVILIDYSVQIDADPGSGVYTIGNGLGYPGSMILKLDPFGNFIWAKGIDDQRHSITLKVDKLDNIYFIGYFRNTVDFDPGPGIFNMNATSTSSTPLFIEKLDASGNFIWAKSFAEGAYISDIDLDLYGNVYITGYYQYSLDFDPGTSTYIMNSAKQTTYIEKLNTNGGFVWALSTTNTGLFYNVGRSICVDISGSIYVGGCIMDSGDLDPTAGAYNIVANGNYDAFILKLDQCNINTIISQTSCSNYLLNGINYTNSGTYGQLLGTSATGCDSTLTLNLILNGPVNTVTQSGNTLTATQSGATYQWINCSTNTAITGENAQSFSVSADGNYAVEINSGSCVDTSACIPFVFTGVLTNDASVLNVYPSPFHDNFTFEYQDNKQQDVQVDITNLLGQIVYKQKFLSDSKNKILLNELPSGMYILKICNDYSSTQKYIIKE
ncbi:MAG: hypothetical protein A3F72_12010 [Bacteroidetes bacterium RIFCSPLOWO2_12_FULL_35_15]|nr:MAG: hypothetical protein A3F72_12010 [Bacteroidetes bacterium RIFCSPLOWO2_12_FULL_35_15]